MVTDDDIRTLRDRLEELEVRIFELEDGRIEPRAVAPVRPRNGLYYADGTNWNPGSGKGFYRYDEDNKTWHYLGQVEGVVTSPGTSAGIFTSFGFSHTPGSEKS